VAARDVIADSLGAFPRSPERAAEVRHRVAKVIEGLSRDPSAFEARLRCDHDAPFRAVATRSCSSSPLAALSVSKAFVRLNAFVRAAEPRFQQMPTKELGVELAVLRREAGALFERAARQQEGLPSEVRELDKRLRRAAQLLGQREAVEARRRRLDLSLLAQHLRSDRKTRRRFVNLVVRAVVADHPTRAPCVAPAARPRARRSTRARGARAGPRSKDDPHEPAPHSGAVALFLHGEVVA
jgi:hypothetical protein